MSKRNSEKSWLEAIVNTRERKSRLHRITCAYEVIIETADDITFLNDTYKFIMKATIPETERGYLLYLLEKKYQSYKTN